MRLPEKRPYWPPKEIRVNPLFQIWRPAGYLLLSEALDVIGRATFGEKWTGAELRARNVFDTVLKPPHKMEDRFIYSPIDIQRVPTGWLVTTTSGNVIVDSEDEALALWRQERPDLVQMWRAERSARYRFRLTARKLRDDLYNGNLRAWAHRPKVGDVEEIPTYVWGRDGIVWVFELGNDPARWLSPNAIKLRDESGKGSVSMEGRVLLLASEVKAYMAKSADAGELLSKTTVAAERECEQWIAGFASQEYKPANKEALRHEAMEKWSSQLSRRSFDRAWARAAPDDWKRSGRKSKHRIDTPIKS